MTTRRAFLLGLGAIGTLDPGAAFSAPSAAPDDDTHPVADFYAKKPMADEFIQPDYAKWKEIKVGMGKDEALKHLGKPLKEERNDDGSMLLYGRLRYSSSAFPEPFVFYIGIEQNKVCSKSDPFDGHLSADGRPTVPRLTVPNDRSSFDHYPRFLDLRWNPSSGVYPMQYTVEWAPGQLEGRGGGWFWGEMKMRPVSPDKKPNSEKQKLVFPGEKLLHTGVPYCVITFAGMSPGRWRVKARNAKGESEWSAYRYFDFKV
jgi:hypothetical protein